MALTPPSSAPNGGSRGHIPGGPVKVLVVDDSTFMRRAISEMITSEPGLEVVDQAKDGQEAIEKAKKHLPDVITLDIEMPVMNGLEALKRIRREARRPGGGGPPAVLMCSSLTTQGSHEALQALRLGAADIIAKDASQFSSTIKEMRDDLVQKIREIAMAARRRAMMPAPTPGAAGKTGGEDEQPTPSLSGTQYDLLVIGSSTGGPPVLETLFAAMPAGLSMPVVVAQHMPVLFTKSMAQRLDAQSAITVVHGEQGMPLLPGTAYILPGGLHGRVVRSAAGRLALDIGPEPTTAVYKPSVNELFSSAAKATGRRTLAVMLTGMGDDGKFGARELKAAGAKLLAQNAATCVVYGMPKAVIEEGLGTALTPPQIARALTSLGGAGARTRAA